MADGLNIKLEFSGGSEFLVRSKEDKLTVPKDTTVKDLLKIVLEQLVTDKNRIDLLFNKTVTEVANGVIVLINDVDFGLLSEYDTILEDSDTITFVSTLHGG